MTTQTLTNGQTFTIRPSRHGGFYVRRVGASAFVSGMFAEDDDDLNALLSHLAGK